MRASLLCCLLLIGCKTQPFQSRDVDAGGLAGFSVDLASPPSFVDLALPPSFDLATSCNDTNDVSIDGSSPFGPFNGRFGWAWYTGADCAETLNLRVESGPYATIGQNVYLNLNFPEPLKLGTQKVGLAMSDPKGTKVIDATGDVTLTRAEPLSSTAIIRIEGTLKVVDAGIILIGHFAADHCPYLDFLCV